MTSVLDLVGVTKTFGPVVAVKDVSMTVQQGETLAIIGPNGAGKSTLFGVIAGQYTPSDGKVILGDRQVTRWPASRLARSGVSRTFQVASLFNSSTVRDNLLLSSAAVRSKALHPWDTFGNDGDAQRAVNDILERLSLSEIASTSCGFLAHGDRKRVELAMALVQEPDILLLDEPTAGMSYEATGHTLILLKEIREEHPDLTIIITAHDMEVIFELATRVLLLSQGEIVLMGSPEEVEHHPTTRKIYLGTGST